ncbi:Exoglucanase 1 [Tulasnella sp. JGI-2019a]|nr:Exoglucanase 1 [Tulasnella sp. JGI-2019a]KAG8993969.1 Exoglucanase 1 [Tulasnella sp. JGI-2019a]KAG9025489.1 Exoglucanase 1 [Tulasnella sp. JGI-2019a]
MFQSAVLLSASLFAIGRAQQVGTQLAEVHPALNWSSCTKTGGCTVQAGKVVLDANWRWVHTTTGYTNCYTGNKWDATICPDPTTCAANCALDGAAYASTYGVTTSGNALTLGFVTGTNVGSRLYLMDTDTTYKEFKPKNQEFTFTVDLSTLPCGLNGALYFSEMAADGGMAAHPTNKAGAKYGTGYCDSQCPRDLKFVNGAANLLGWNATSANSGTGQYGSCCSEMDIWEANSMSAAYTPHPCSGTGLVQCSGSTCTSTCDQAGCDFNSYRWGNTSFYGAGKTVDTTKPFTIVTQFITSDNTATGTLTEIRRLYIQNGKTIQNSVTNVPGLAAYNSISDAFCAAQKTVTGDTNTFAAEGGLKVMGDAMARGMVLVLSIWDDYAVNMLWLDSDYPTTASPTAPGVARGSCATTSGKPADVEAAGGSVHVIYSDIRFGDIGSTYTGDAYVAPGGSTTGTTTAKTTTTTAKTTSTTSKATTTSTASGATQTHYGQCGGSSYTGPTVCASPYTCTYSSAFYSQCL